MHHFLFKYMYFFEEQYCIDKIVTIIYYYGLLDGWNENKSWLYGADIRQGFCIYLNARKFRVA